MNGLPTPQQYIAAASLGYVGFRDTVVAAAKHYLATTKAANLSTKELTDALWPNHLAQGTAIEIRKRMVDTLLKCAQREMSMCARKGPVMGKAYGHLKRPWLWSAPPTAEMQVWADDHEDHGGTPHDDNAADIEAKSYPYDAGMVRQTLVDCIGATGAGQFLTVRDRASIADEIMKKTRVVLA